MLDMTLYIVDILPEHQARKISDVYPSDGFWMEDDEYELFTIIGYHYPLGDEGSRTSIFRLNNENIELYAYDYFKENYENNYENDYENNKVSSRQKALKLAKDLMEMT